MQLTIWIFGKKVYDLLRACVCVWEREWPRSMFIPASSVYIFVIQNKAIYYLVTLVMCVCVCVLFFSKQTHWYT